MYTIDSFFLTKEKKNKVWKDQGHTITQIKIRGKVHKREPSDRRCI